MEAFSSTPPVSWTESLRPFGSRSFQIALHFAFLGGFCLGDYQPKPPFPWMDAPRWESSTKIRSALCSQLCKAFLPFLCGIMRLPCHCNFGGLNTKFDLVLKATEYVIIAPPLRAHCQLPRGCSASTFLSRRLGAVCQAIFHPIRKIYYGFPPKKQIFCFSRDYFQVCRPKFTRVSSAPDSDWTLLGPNR